MELFGFELSSWCLNVLQQSQKSNNESMSVHRSQHMT